MLADKGYNSLRDAISQYHGGFPALRIKLGQENLRGRWKDFEYVKQQAQQVMKEYGWTTLPGSNMLIEKGYSGLSNAINKYHGGFIEFRKRLGQQTLFGRWKNLDYTVRQAKRAMKEQGWKTLPSSDALRANGYGGLAGAISLYHGGLTAFRIKLGQENPMGRWTDLNYTIQQARQAMKEQKWKTFPSSRVLVNKGYSSLYASISKYHGGFANFRPMLGEGILRGQWKDLDYTIKQAQRAMKEQGWKSLPSTNALKDKGYGDLCSAIARNHGGLLSFRTILGQMNPLGRWKDLDYTIRQAQQAMKEQRWDVLPSSHVLIEKEYYGLIYAIRRYHGGIPAFRETLSKAQGQLTPKERLENILNAYTRPA
jgi:phosphoribosyl-dephospho-CoA transferase